MCRDGGTVTGDLLARFAPGSDPSRLTLTGVTSGAVSYSFTAHDTAAARMAHVSLLGTNFAII